MSRARLRLLGLVLSLTLAFGAGYATHALALAPTSSVPAGAEHYAGFSLFWEAWDLVGRYYVQPERAEPKTLTYGAIQGMLDSLGDAGHTRFLTPEERQRWNESLSGHFVGIGVEIALREGQPVVLAPIPGAPAEAAGIRAGDIILEIEGRSTAGITFDELARQLRGAEGSRVTLTIRHADGDAPVGVTVERRRVDVPSVSWTLAPGTRIAHIRLSQFAEGAHEELVTALRAARAVGARGLILDLRNNPGGLLHEAVATASEFLAGGVILQVQSRDGTRQQQTDLDGTGGAATDLPLVVLVNEGSASSAEIVAGALKEHGRAPVLGERTVGTGTVLSTYELSDGSAVLLGTALWLTPNGNALKEQGITPDVPVALPPGATPLRPSEVRALSPEALRASQDRQLLRAVDNLCAGDATSAHSLCPGLPR